MKRMTAWAVAVAVAAGGALVRAQSAPSLQMPMAAVSESGGPAVIDVNGAASPLSTESCAYNFSVAGAQNSFLKYCVTVNGNIVSFNSPNGNDQIAQGGFAEGYGICDFSTGISYFDYAYTESGNWNSPVLVALTTGMVKIARTTSDGAWTLTQTITKTAGPSPSAKVTMAIKNNSGAQKEFYLLRYADVDPSDANSTGNFQESFDSSKFSAWGYEALNSGRPAIGLKIT